MRGLVLIGAIISVGASAAAQPAADGSSIALALFDQGKRLAAQRDYVHACEKFEAAHARVSWLGVELNLADCDEHIGKMASAWVLFLKAAADADRQADARAAYARARAAKLEPDLAHVTIRAGAGAEIRFDGAPFNAAELGTALPVDPGAHVVNAAAVGYVAWSQEIAVGVGAAVDVDVPPLAAEITPAPAPAVVSTPVVAAPAPAAQPVARSPLRRAVDSPSGARRWRVWAIAGAGVATVGASLLVGLDAKLRFDDALDGHCSSSLACDGRGYQMVHEARTRGDVATGLGIAGGTALAAAGILYLVTRHHIAPVIAPTSLGITVQGSL